MGDLSELVTSNKNGDILVIKDIPKNVTDETLENYLEVICQVGVHHLYFHGLPKCKQVSEVAIVVLEERLTDLQKIREKTKTKKIEGQVIQLCKLVSPAGVIVFGLPRETTEDELTLYFERKNVAGSNADVTECKIHRRIDVGVVHYKNKETALQFVFKVKHRIRDKDLTVEPYYTDFHNAVIQCLMDNCGSPGDNGYEDLIKNTTQEDDVVILRRGDKCEIGMKNTTAEAVDVIYTREDNHRSSKTGSRLRMFSQDMEEYKETDDEGYEIPVTSGGRNEHNDVTTVDDAFYESIQSGHKYYEIPPEVPITPRPSEKRRVGPCNLEDSCNDEVSMEKGKIVLLRIKGFSKMCTECHIDLNTSKDVVSFTGSKDAVIAAKLKMFKELEGITEVNQVVTKGHAAVLKARSSWIKNTLKQEKVGAFGSVKGDNLLCIQAFSKPVAEKGLKNILSRLDTVEISYTEVHFKYLNSEDWKVLEASLQNKNEVVIEMDRQKKQICIEGKKEACQTAKDVIKKELGKHAEGKTEKIEIKGSESAIFHYGLKQQMDKVRNELSKKHGSLNYKHDKEKQTTVIELKGDPGTVEETKAEILQMIKAIWNGPVDLKRISKKDEDLGIMSKALDSRRGKDFISTFEKDNTCVVNIVKGKEKYELQQTHSEPSFNKESSHDLARRHTVADFQGGARPKDGPSQDRWSTWKCSTHFGSVEVILKQGIIANEKADVLVNVIADNSKFTSSRVTQSFINRSSEFEKKYMLAKQQWDGKGYVLTTDNSGIPQCKAICHLHLPKWTGDKSVLATAISNCFKMCSKMNAQSVAFPPVGFGQLLQYPLDEVIGCLIAESKVAAQKSQSIQKIKFIIFDDDTVDKFEEIIKGSSASGGHGNRSHDKDHDHKEKSTHTGNHRESVTAVTIELFAVSKQDGEKLRTKLSEDIKETFLYENKIKNPKLKSVSRETKSKMYAAANQNHVWIDHNDESLTFKGEKDNVTKTKEKIYEILLKDESRGRGNYHKKYSSEYWIEESQKSTETPDYWKHKGIFGTLKDKGKEVFLGIVGNLVDVDDKTRNKVTSLVGKTWISSLVGQGKDARGLSHSKIVVTRVQRIENSTLYEKYFAKKKEFYRKLAHGKQCPAIENVSSKGKKVSKGPILTAKCSKALMTDMDLASHANEFYFFHGTPDEYVKNIVNKGIDEKLGGDNSMFGPGIYGAESSTKADQYADDQNKRQNKDRKMLLIRLLLGNMFVTDKAHKYKIPPCSRCLTPECRKHDHEPFDSVVADGSWLFREFIVYRNEQCYPEYLITYDRV